jgi:hypothetical protein
MRTRSVLSLVVLGMALSWFGCTSSSDDDAPSPSKVIAADALSQHYVRVTLAEPLGSAAGDTGTWLIRDQNGAVLPITNALVSSSGREVTLTTARQQPTQYELTLAMNLGIGAAGFVGSSVREPFLESALPLDDTTVQLTFSEPLDRQLAENEAFYRLLDPDTDLDVDIEITAAELNDDLRTVLLTTTPQENRLYTVQVTNIKSRFSCDDGDLTSFIASGSAAVCAQTLRPVDSESAESRFRLTARTGVARGGSSNSDPEAPGSAGTVQTSNSGAGVGSATCSGNPCASASGSAANEELTIDFDVPTRADTVVLDMIGRGQVDIVVFLSSATASGFDFTITAAQSEAVTVGDGSELHLGAVTSLPADLMIDRVRVRATAGASCMASLCVRDGRTVDPTRNLANFYGIPSDDEIPPTVLSVVSTGNTTILVTFSEPVRPESADPANFTIAPELSIVSAVLTEQQNQILLTTAPQQADVTYTVTVSNIVDRAGNAIVTGAGDTGTFVYEGAPETADATTAPRVVGAASVGNTAVVVTFSKAMSDDAENASNYAIVIANVNPEVGAVSVVEAEFLGDDGTAVLLTTRPQNEVTYTVIVTNVRDRFGNQLAPRELQAGIVNDPRSASFAGTPWSCVTSCQNEHDGLGEGVCGSDDDCTDEDECEEGESCEDACACPTPDPDGDGLSDFDEQRGWVVFVVLTTGETFSRQVTSSPDSEDTDGDGLSDATERAISTDPRDWDTDDDLISDYDEYNVIYSDATRQDSDGDSLDDLLEVEWYKTNALTADSDGDGFSDGDELFSIHRDPRIADLPDHAISVGRVRLQLDQRFTYVDAEGRTQTEANSVSSALENATASGSSSLNQTVGHWLLGAEGGLDSCQTDEACNAGFSFGWLDRLNFKFMVSGGQEFTTANTLASERSTQQAYAQSIENGLELSSDSEVTREVVGASMLVDLSFSNTSDVAITLENLEVRASTSDPNDPTNMVPIATLVPESTILTGQAVSLRIGPGQTRGPIVFASRDLYPSLVESLMRAPRGIVFNIANFDMITGDDRNFAQGLQEVRQRTVAIRIDKGDGVAREHHVITAGVLDRARDDMRCAQTGSNPGALCSTDGDCGDSAPCEGGQVVGGFSQFGGTGGETPLPLDFVLRDSLGLRRSTPAVILATGATARTAANPESDDVQVIDVGEPATLNAVVVAPGRNGILETAPVATDYASEGMRLVAGDNGTVDSEADGDDVQVQPFEAFPLAPAAVVLAAGPNGVIDSDIEGDDALIGPDGIRPGEDGAVDSVARGDDVQLVPIGTTGVPDDVVVIHAGNDGVLDSAARGDDALDVVSGYEISRTCDGDTPFRILAGRDGFVSTLAEDGVCVVAFAPHYPGEQCESDADCGSDPADDDDDEETLGECRSDDQALGFETGGHLPSAVAIAPDGALSGAGRQFLESVPAGDDVFVGPGIPCTDDADCTVGAEEGSCDGPQQVVRVEDRRRGQFRRKWALLMSDGTQLQTDFAALTVRAGDQITLAFVQDVDRDGLVAAEEFLHGSSDFRRDTDDDQLGDFSEIRIGWDIGVVGQLLRRVFPDPRRPDSDFDGLTDLEEQDLRITQCACNAEGPKSLLGSGNLLSGDTDDDERAQPCTSDAQCGNVDGACRDAVHCVEGVDCPRCPLDVTLSRTDPRASDTDEDRATDAEETFGYLTGAGIVDPDGTDPTRILVLAGDDLTADTLACPGNACIEDGAHCMTDGDCGSHFCIHADPCSDVQVLPPGTGVRDPRTVVAIVELGGPTNIASSDDDETLGDSIAASNVAGDDLLIVGRGQSTGEDGLCEDGGDFAFCAAIKPGVDGVLSSTIGGDDALVLGGFGQRREVSDPLNPDTDMDLVADGFERILGSSPNQPGDAAFGGDIDQDGLTDTVERAGWDVEVTIDGLASTDEQSSNPLVADTDFDGLPDYAEKNAPCYSESAVAPCSTDPNKPDTDGDGISDFDELSLAQLELLERNADFFPGYELDATESAAYGTDPLNDDSDGDGLEDRFELFVGWLVLRADGTVERVYSDPTSSDTDGDNLDDDGEFNEGSDAKTDPTDPDTDDDRRMDGQEHLIGSNPLRPDLGVTVTYAHVELSPPRSGESAGNSEWKWGFFVQRPGGPFPGEMVSDQFDCPRYDSCICITDYPERSVPLNKSISFDLSPGEALVLSGMIRETHDNRALSCPGGDTSVYSSDNDGDRYMSFIEQPITYEQLQGGNFTSRTISMASGDDDTGTTSTVFVEISVDCAGSGRGICRTGSFCATGDDCETGECAIDAEDPDRRRCVDLCGNGVPDDDEMCDDGNQAACGTCNADCSETITFPGCAGGTGCLTPDDCASGVCSGGVCTNACGNGWVEGDEQCDDGNTSACGSCNGNCTFAPLVIAPCANGTECQQNVDCTSNNCVEGVCAPRCGNGVIEAPELCDDGNPDACGNCSASCGAVNPLPITGCPLEAGCMVDTDCASANCEDGLCAE